MTIKEASYSISHITDLSEYVLDNRSLIMIQGYDTLRFVYEDHSIPRYEERNTLVCDGTYSHIQKVSSLENKEAIYTCNNSFTSKKEFVTNETRKVIGFLYPFYYRDVADRIVAKTCGIFYTGDYTFVKGGQERVTDYNKVEELIKEAIEEFNK